MRALPGRHSFLRIAAPLKKRIKKNTFFAMILPRRPPVNFANNVLGYKKSIGSEILQRTAKKI